MKPSVEYQSTSIKPTRFSPRITILLCLVLVGIIAAVYLIFFRNGGEPRTITTASGLQYQDLVVGKGEAAKAGDTPVVHYTAWLLDGTKINSSLDKGEPYEFHLGTGEVLPGFDEGVMGMRVGGKRKLIIPPDLAYGATGASQIIGPNETLIFEVELLSLK